MVLEWPSEYVQRVNRALVWKVLSGLIVALSIHGACVYYFMTIDERGLKDYAEEFLPKSISGIDCAMEPRSRKGACFFEMPPDAFQTLQKTLELFPTDETEKGFLRDSTCARRFDRLSIDDAALLRKPTAPEVYKAAKPPRPMRGNNRTSFLDLYYDSRTDRACLVLEYPYG